MKGIVLAGGKGTRLYPITRSISKHLLPVYDKPMIYYPISILMLSGIKDIMIISDPAYIIQYKDLLGNGSSFGVNFTYKEQQEPKGIADAFLLAEDFIGSEKVALILGDNIFYGQGISSMLQSSFNSDFGAELYAYAVNDPQNFGVIEFENDVPVSIVEKPTDPISNLAVTGLYFYDNSVVSKAKKIKPSHRGELEITDINKLYLSEKNIKVNRLGRGFTWLDSGSPEGLIDASTFVHTIQKRQGYQIACLEEIALIKGWINKKNIKMKIGNEIKTKYDLYLNELIK